MAEPIPNLADVEKSDLYEKYWRLEEQYRLSENLLSKIMRDHENQKKHLSLELFHVIAQTIYSLLLGIRMTLDSDANEMLKVYLRKLENSAEDVLEKVKRLSFDLYPLVIDDFGFIAAVTNYLKLQKDTGISTNLKIYGEKKRVHSEKELLLYRVIQEVLLLLIYEFKENSIKIILSFYEKPENKFLFFFAKGEKEHNKETIEAGLVVTMKRLLEWKGNIYIQEKHDEWLIEAIIP